MKEKLYNIAYLRAVACAAVVLLHVAASEVILYQDVLTDLQRFGATCAYNLMMWAVPCFIMVSGALLLDPTREIPLSRIFKGYVRRILSALIVFGMIFRIFDMLMDGEGITLSGIGRGLYEIYTGTGWSHIWYLYLLIGLYLILPFLKTMTAHAKDEEIRYFLGINALVLSIAPISKIFGAACGFYIHISTIYPFYFVAGYAIHKKILRLPRALAGVCVLAGSCGMALFTGLQTFNVLASVGNLLGYASIFTVLESIGIFALVDGIPADGSSRTGRLLQKVDDCSFGIYLFHMILVRLVLRYWNVDLFSFGCAPMAFAGMTLVTFAVSFAVIAVLKRVPLIRKAGII